MEQGNSIYSTKPKADFVEHFSQTYSDLNEEPVDFEGKACLLTHLDFNLRVHNTKAHSTVNMSHT